MPEKNAPAAITTASCVAVAVQAETMVIKVQIVNETTAVPVRLTHRLPLILYNLSYDQPARQRPADDRKQQQAGEKTRLRLAYLESALKEVKNHVTKNTYPAARQNACRQNAHMLKFSAISSTSPNTDLLTGTVGSSDFVGPDP
ncbi:MAG: hypothetical protein GKR94_08205 [Gammaproteobacteria bacterium]|nr:hypothetical protein [Gammaproteobacteria bacterium]